MWLLNVTGQHDQRIENLTRQIPNPAGHCPLFSALHNAILDTFTIKEGVFDNSGWPQGRELEVRVRRPILSPPPLPWSLTSTNIENT